jgi:hypothetical protein
MHRHLNVHLPATHTTVHIHVTTLLIAIAAALCAERILVAYSTRKLARRRGRMWMPYALFGLVGMAVLALRAPAYSVLSSHVRPRKRTGYTHVGFSGPVPEAEVELYPAKRKRRRLSPLHGYHFPHGVLDEHAR